MIKNANLPNATTDIGRINRDAFITTTMVSFAKLGHYLNTMEWSLEELKRSGVEQIVRSFGIDGRLESDGARQLLKSHLETFDKDMTRSFRYSVVVSLYTLCESRARQFMGDFDKTYPGKPDFRDFANEKKNKKNGFIVNFRSWLEAAPTAVILEHPRIWDRLDDFRIVRNCIAHANGDLSLPRDQKKLKEAVESSRGGAKIDSFGTLVLEASYAAEFVGLLSSFFCLLFSAVGYGMETSPGYAETMNRGFAEFENDMAVAKEAYYKRQPL